MKKLYKILLFGLGVCFLVLAFIFSHPWIRRSKGVNVASVISKHGTLVLDLYGDKKSVLNNVKNGDTLLNIYSLNDINHIFVIDLSNRLSNLSVVDVISDSAVFDENVLVNYVKINGLTRPVFNLPNINAQIGLRSDKNALVLLDKKGYIKKVFYYSEETIKTLETVSKKFSKTTKRPVYPKQLSYSFIKSLKYIRYVKLHDSVFFVVSDSIGRKIYVININGDIVNQIGNGEKGDTDGIASETTFCSPFGLAVEENNLYVADICNNSVRKVDLTTFTTSTVIKNIRSPFDVELLNNRLFISTQDGIFKYRSQKLEFVSDDYTTKMVLHNGKIYYINRTDSVLYSIDSNDKVSRILDAKKFYEDNSIDGVPTNIFYADGTALYFVDTFNNRVIEFNNSRAIMHNGNTYNLPTDMIDFMGKLYILNEGNKKIVQFDKATKATKVMNINFGYEFNNIRSMGKFLNINNVETELLNTYGSKIIFQLKNNHFFDETAPQNLFLFKENTEDNTAVLIKAYNKHDILTHNILSLPELDDNSVYYVEGSLFYKDDKNSPTLVNNYNAKIETSSAAVGKSLVINFL